jgi:RecB family exonuclease
LFVGITRAKYDLTISYSNINNGKPVEFTSRLADVLKNNDFFEVTNHEITSKEYSLELVKSYTKKQYDYVGDFKDEIKTRIKDLRLSPSTLNSYLKCPRNFFYTYILKIPVYESDWDKANYGTAIHKTLENAVHNLLSTGSYPDLKGFIEDFNKNLANEEFETEEVRETYRKRGENSLKNYYSHFVETSADRIEKVEYSLDSVPTEYGIITGKIDRVEKNKQGEYCLYDYKTGKSKSKSQIADGKEYENYLNQLRFYKYAFETLNKGTTVSTVGLIFPEDYTGNFYYNPTDMDNDEIESKISETFERIAQMDFEPAEKDQKNCKYCSYKQLCNLNLF